MRHAFSTRTGALLVAAADSDQPPASWVSAASGAHDETLLENWLFRVRRERFASRKSGKSHDFYVMHLADGVQVLALTPADELVLLRQFRAGSRRDSLEMPGGLIEAGEDPALAAARELLEETGYAGEPAEVVGVVWSNPAVLSMRITTLIVRHARRRADPSPDQTEELTIELIPRREIPLLIKSGAIDHAATVAGLSSWLVLQGMDSDATVR
jgi:8-oxo-dGTP pyrophosphatase MutT (NUDIX family)